MTRVLLSRHAAEKLAAELSQLSVTPVVLDGQVEDIEVAWGSSDLFQSREDTRRFFGATTRSSTLRWMQVSGAGSDDPVFRRLATNGVILTTSHVTGPPIAEYVMRAVLDRYQGAERWRAAAQERRWRAHEFREVLGTTWLVIGFGSIGVEVAARAQAFGATVVATRRKPVGDEPVEVVAPDAIPDVLPRADVVVLALPATAATIGLVDAAFLGRMKHGSVIVNVARGSLIDEPALLAALDRGLPEAALLDVAGTEPPPEDSPLWTHPNVVLTPHSSALGLGRHGRAEAVFVENLRRYVNGERLANVVPQDEILT